MRGLFLDSLTSLVGDVFRGVTNSTSRMKESVLFHKEEEEKKYKQMEERKNKEVAKLKEELKERDRKIKEDEEELKTREKRAKEDEAKHKKEVAKLKGEVEERNKQIKTNEEELKTREKRAKEDEAKHKKEVAKLKGEVEERSRKIKEDEANHKQEVANLQKSFHIRIGQFEKEVAKLKKKLEDKDGVIGELKKHNAGLRVAFDLNAGVNMQMEDLDAKIEEANLEARNLKRSRQELEETAGPEMKKVCAAVIQLRSNDVANGLKMIEASANIIAPAVAMSKNAKRRAQRAKNGGGNGLKGNKYCGICKEFFRLDL